MSVNQILAFLGGPYGVVADVKMLNFFRILTLSGIAVLVFLAVASLFVQSGAGIFAPMEACSASWRSRARSRSSATPGCASIAENAPGLAHRR